MFGAGSLMPLSALDASAVWNGVFLWACSALLGCKAFKTPLKTLHDILLIVQQAFPWPPPPTMHSSHEGHACHPLQVTCLEWVGDGVVLVTCPTFGTLVPSLYDVNPPPPHTCIHLMGPTFKACVAHVLGDVWARGLPLQGMGPPCPRGYLPCT